MKTNISKWCLAGVLAMALSSCGDFFKESSQDEIKPTTVEDLQATFFHDGYPYNFSSDSYLNLLTDEVQNNGLTNDHYADRLKMGQPVFTFNADMFEGALSFIDDENSWKNYYSLVMGCNVALDYVDAMTGTDKDKQNLKGQARLLRAFYFLKLATIYCQPYSNNPDNNLGISLVTTSAVNDAYPKRASLRDTYDFIESELKQAKEELKDYKPTTHYRVTSECADILLSRLYLYEEKWDECIASADEAIKNGPSLTNLNALIGKDDNVYDASSTEVVWNYNGKFYDSQYINKNDNWGTAIPYSLSTKIATLYDQANDLRYKKYVNNFYSFFFVGKASFNSQYDGEHGLRMAEVYLNRAEAYARKSINGDAAAATKSLADINALRESRYTAGTYASLADIQGEKLLELVLQERQRELVWEDGFRWMDIKRNHLSVTHAYTDDTGATHEYTLKADDPLYALPIPASAISRNPNLQQNPR